MGLILDTIIYANLLFSPEMLSEKDLAFIDEQKELYVTMPTLWEMANHFRKGTYSTDNSSFEVFIKTANKDLNIKVLPISWKVMDWLSTEPYLVVFGKEHKDTFDRMIIAHGIISNLPIITKDNFFPAYSTVGLHCIHI